MTAFAPGAGPPANRIAARRKLWGIRGGRENVLFSAIGKLKAGGWRLEMEGGRSLKTARVRFSRLQSPVSSLELSIYAKGALDKRRVDAAVRKRTMAQNLLVEGDRGLNAVDAHFR